MLNTAADTASNTLFLADRVPTISRTPIPFPATRSTSSLSTILLNSSLTLSSSSSPSACVSASALSASSCRPCLTNHRGDSGTNGSTTMHSKLNTPCTSDGVRHAHVLG